MIKHKQMHLSSSLSCTIETGRDKRANHKIKVIRNHHQRLIGNKSFSPSPLSLK